MASAGDTFSAKSIYFKTATSYNDVGNRSLESDGTNLFFNGSQLGSAGNVFDYMTVSNITSTSSNVTILSNLVLQEYSGVINPIDSATEGLQAKGGLLYFNGVQMQSQTNLFDIFTTNVVTSGTGNVITFQSDVLLNKDIFASNIKFSNDLSLVSTVTGKEVRVVGDVSNVSFTSTASGNLAGTDISNLKFKITGDSGDSAREHVCSQITNKQNSAFNGAGGGGLMTLACRQGDVNAVGTNDPMVDMLTLETHPTTGNVVTISADSTFKVGSTLIVDSDVTLGSSADLKYPSGIAIIDQSGTTVRIGQSSSSSPPVNSIAIGNGSKADEKSVTIGVNAGGSSGSNVLSVSIGYDAGITGRNNGVAIGAGAGTFQQDNGVAIGYEAQTSPLGPNGIAIGNQAGKINQGEGAEAIGFGCGYQYQGCFSVAIGYFCGSVTQGERSCAIGTNAARSHQGSSSVAIGDGAAQNSQGTQSIAIGRGAGKSQQNDNSIALGFESGHIYQSTNSIAVGKSAGYNRQGGESAAIGTDSGYTSQGAHCKALGYRGA